MIFFIHNKISEREKREEALQPFGPVARALGCRNSNHPTRLKTLIVRKKHGKFGMHSSDQGSSFDIKQK